LTLTERPPADLWATGRHRALSATRGQRWIPPAAGALVGAVVFALTSRSLVDDAYITLTYVKTLGLHGQWGMVEGLSSNTATSPLNVLFVGGLTAVTRDAIAGLGVGMAVMFAAAGWWLTCIGRSIGARPWRAPIFGLAFLATSPLLWSTVGLESYLAAVLLLGALAALLARRPWWAGVAAGALVLTRPDLMVFGALAVLLCGRAWWKAALTAVAVTVPWFAWSWYFLGSAVPDSLLLKAGSTWGYWTYATGPELWFATFPAAVVLSAIPAALGVLALVVWPRPLLRVPMLLGGGALAHAALFMLVVTPPFHWYYAPAISGLGLLAALAAARARGLTGTVTALAGVGLTLVCAASVLNDGLPRDRAPIASNWASPAQYRAIADSLPRRKTVQSPGEVGTLAYYYDCRGCRVIDGFADPALLHPLIQKRIDAAGALGKKLLRANYHRFELLHGALPQRVDYTMPVWAIPADGAPMVGSWGDGRGWTLRPPS